MSMSASSTTLKGGTVGRPTKLNMLVYFLYESGGAVTVKEIMARFDWPSKDVLKLVTAGKENGLISGMSGAYTVSEEAMRDS